MNDMSYRLDMEKREHLIIRTVVVISVWVVSMFLWSIWLEGILVPITALFTSLIFELVVHVGAGLAKIL